MLRLPLLLVALVAFAIAGCGQKGPLYLSDNPPPGVKSKAQAYKPVPYPRDTREAAADEK